MTPQEEEKRERESMVKVEFYVPPAFIAIVEKIAGTYGFTKSELYRQALFLGITHYAERSNKIQVNNRLSKKTENDE